MHSLVRALVLLAALSAPIAGFAVEPGSPAPSLRMPRMDGSGKPLSVSDYRGKVVYVDFWASWCLPCRISMPTLERLYKDNADKGFAVIGVNKDVRSDDAERFLKRVPVSFPLVADGSDDAAKAFKVKTMPSGYLVDRKGVVRHVHGGFTRSTSEELEKQLGRLLEEKP